MLNPTRAHKIEPVIRSLLQDLHVFSYEPEDANATAAVRAALAKRGTPIGPYDVMIAGTALRRGGPTDLDSFRGRDKWNSAGYAAAASG